MIRLFFLYYSTVILNIWAKSVSPPALVISPSLTPASDLSGLCLNVAVKDPEPAETVVSVNSIPIGSPFKSESL